FRFRGRRLNGACGLARKAGLAGRKRQVIRVACRLDLSRKPGALTPPARPSGDYFEKRSRSDFLFTWSGFVTWLAGTTEPSSAGTQLVEFGGAVAFGGTTGAEAGGGATGTIGMLPAGTLTLGTPGGGGMIAGGVMP